MLVELICWRDGFVAVAKLGRAFFFDNDCGHDFLVVVCVAQAITWLGAFSRIIRATRLNGLLVILVPSYKFVLSITFCGLEWEGLYIVI